MLATGVFMACTWSSKVNGILTVVAIGIAVVVDLWDLLDWRKSDNVCTYSPTHEHFPDACRRNVSPNTSSPGWSVSLSFR